MYSRCACRLLSVILIPFHFHLSLVLLFGAGLFSESPIPHSPSLIMLCFMNHTGTLVNECLLLSCLRERCYHDATVSRTLIIPTLVRHRGHRRPLKLTFVWHLSCNIYLRWVVWHLRCDITLLWISILFFVGLIWYHPYGRKSFNLTNFKYCCTKRSDEESNKEDEIRLL